MSEKCFAAISLSPAGGGVATASRLMWSAIENHWRGEAQLITLAGRNPPSNPAPSMLKRLRFGARLARAQALRECDWVFYSHLGVAQVQTYLPAAAVQRPYGIFLHGIEVWRPLSAAQQRVLNSASLLVANSTYTASRARQTHPWLGEISVCPLAIPPGEPSRPREERAAVRRHRVLVVGRMDRRERYKGHDQLIDAWPLVLRRCPDAELLFAGGGDDEERLLGKVRAAGLDQRVTFAGFLESDSLTAAYDEAAIFAMPSRNEGFGLVYIEAMARGVPAIGSTEDAARDVIVDGRTGFLVAQGDLAALADRIVLLLSDDARRREMGEEARRHVRLHFSFDQFARTFTTLLVDRLDRVSRATSVPVTASR